MILKLITVLFLLLSVYIYFFKFTMRNIYLDICIFCPIIWVFYDYQKRNKIKLDPKINELYKCINLGDFKKFKEIVETKFNNMKEVEKAYYYVKIDIG